MKKLTLTVCCFSSLIFAGSSLACEYPANPTLPNGSTASKEEMVAGQKEVKGYIKKLEDYQKCIVAEEEAARAELELEPDAVQQREELLTKKYNAAHDEMMKVAAAFNAELKEYQSRDED